MDSTELAIGEEVELGSEETKRRSFDFIKRRRRHIVAALQGEFHRVQAKTDSDTLRACPTIAEAVSVLRRRPEDPTKIALTEALLLEVRLGSRGLSMLLVIGYLPMLEYVLQFGNKMVHDVGLRESMVLEAFSQVIADYRGLLGNPCLHLHHETRRRYRRAEHRLHRETSHVDLAELDELDQHHLPWWETKRDAAQGARGLRASLAESSEEVTELLRRELGGKMSAKRLELVEATILRGEDLATYVDRTFPGLSAVERSRTYERLRRKRSRTVHALRRLLKPWREATIQKGTTEADEGGRAVGSEALPRSPAPSAPISFNEPAPMAAPVLNLRGVTVRRPPNFETSSGARP